MGLLDTLEPTGRNGSSGSVAADTFAPPSSGAEETSAWARASGTAEPVSRGRTDDDPWARPGRPTRNEVPGPTLPWADRSAPGTPVRSATARPTLRHRLTGLRTRPLPPTARRARILLWRRRHPLAALLLGLAATLAVQLLRPPPPPSVDIVVTARPVAAGTQLTREDVALRTIAADLAPPGAARSTRALLGRAAVVGLPAGAPLHAALVSDDGVSAAAPRGTVVVPVRLSDDAVAALLRPGDRVDLLAGTTSGVDPATDPQYLARAALVLPVPAGRAPGTPGELLGPAAEADRPVTLVAVAPDEAPGLSAVSGWGSVAAVLVP